MITTTNQQTRVEHIYTKDPAIVVELSNVGKYLETSDPTHLVTEGVPTIFVLKAAGSIAYRNAMAKAAGYHNSSQSEYEGESALVFSFELVRSCVVQIRNFKQEGDCINFQNGLSTEVLDSLPLHCVMELADVALKLTNIVEGTSEDRNEKK